MLDGFKRGVRKWLELEPADPTKLSIKSMLDWDTEVFLNRIWLRGKSYELEQTYKGLALNDGSFWASVPSAGMELRKIHTGLPHNIVQMLTDLTMVDFNEVETGNPELDAVLEENGLAEAFRGAVRTALALGDGAFKVSYDTELSGSPILEFYPADEVEFRTLRGRVREVVFKTAYKEQGSVYTLCERYGYGFINYELYDVSGNPCELDRVPMLAGLQNITWGDTSVILAVPFKIFDNETYKDRGRSIFANKRDNFDALDEVFSQWLDALRANRTKTYIPDDLIPRNPRTGELLRPNAFDNRFIAAGTSAKETDRNEIVTVSPGIPSADYLSVYVTALDLCLQGIISPSTLGIDAKKLDNAEAQREKEKATLYTRDAIISAVQDTAPLVVNALWAAYCTAHVKPFAPVEYNAKFGEYANPSFESQVETLAKAKTAGIVSIEALVDELYGDTKPSDWKAQEVARIKEQQGIVGVGELPSTGLGMPLGFE